MSLSRFCKPIVTAREDEPIVVVARKLRDEHVGCVIITRNDRPIGVLTDRDLSSRVVAEGRDPNAMRAADVVTYDPILVSKSDDVAQAAAIMREHGVRRLPIVDHDGALVGLVTADDLVLLIGRELGDLSVGIEAAADSDDSR